MFGSGDQSQFQKRYGHVHERTCDRQSFEGESMYMFQGERTERSQNRWIAVQGQATGVRDSRSVRYRTKVQIQSG